MAQKLALAGSVAPQISGAAEGEWGRLREIARKNTAPVVEWLKAVKRIKEAKLYHLADYKTFEEYCKEELGKAASSVRYMLSQSRKATDGAVGKQPNVTTDDGRENYACSVGKSLTGVFKKMNVMLDAWPTAKLAKNRKAEMKKKLFDWYYPMSSWMAEQGGDFTIEGFDDDG